MLCLPIEIEIFEMVEKKIKNLWENTFFSEKGDIYL